MIRLKDGSYVNPEAVVIVKPVGRSSCPSSVFHVMGVENYFEAKESPDEFAEKINKALCADVEPISIELDGESQVNADVLAKLLAIAEEETNG